METVAPKGFSEMVQSDPLFAAEGMDLERASKVLDEIETITSSLEDILGQSSLWRRLFLIRYPIARYALPIPFLRDLIESERARRQFLSRPTMSMAGTLVQRWDVAQGSLEKSTQRFALLHRILRRVDQTRGSSEPVQDTHGNITTLQDIDQQVRRMEENARILRDLVRERAMVLRGTRPWDPARKGKNITDVATLRARGEMPEKYMRVHALECIHSLPYRESTIFETHGPFVYVLPHFDGAPTPHTFMLYMLRNNISGVESVRVASLDTYKFIKIGGSDENKYPRVGRAAFEPLITMGVPYWFQSTTSLYAMRDQQYWADVVTIADVHRRQHLDHALLQKQRSSLLDLLLGACLEDHKIYLENVHQRRGFWYWLLFRTHPSIYFVPFNGSVWRLPEKTDFIGSMRANPEDMLYKNLDFVLAHTTPEEFELVMRGGRIRAEAWEAEKRY